MVLSYEFIGVKIFGIVSDAGGGDTKMFKLLQGHNVVKGPWPDAKCLSFANPTDKYRSIYMWSCGTHNFKALRNNIHRSQLTKTKSFRTDLNIHSVYLDNFTVMNASYAKKCFSEKTISEMLVYVSARMNVRLDIGLKFPSLWHQFMFTCNSLTQKVTVDTPLEVKYYISILQYQITVRGIYIERLFDIAE